MTTTENTTTSRYGTIVGTRPIGRADGTERWASITSDDGMLIVTASRGWGITDEVRLHGKTAVSLAESIAHQLIGDFA